MIQNNYYVSEQDYDCSLCHEPVTNPLCPMCITTQVDAWLTYYPNYHELRDYLIPKIRKYLSDNLRQGILCIKCNDKTASICPVCFTEFVLDELRKLEVSKLVLKEFLKFFNFHSENRAYKKLVRAC